MKGSRWEKNLFELIRRTATDLPSDVETALRKALLNEKKWSHGWWVLESILQNVELARKKDVPICQDSGSLIFHFSVPVGFDTNALVAFVRSAVSKATRSGYLRQNTIDSISGASYETNVAHGSPQFYFQQGARKTVEVRLMMKGGGSENIGCQYSLPDASLNAERNIEGVRKCILKAICDAQGKGCPPCAVGVCIGGDRASGYAYAEAQFLRKINDRSNVKIISRLEKRILKDATTLGIGPMGLGGRTTVLAVKIDSLSRLPASFFVSISFMCWAYRRRGAVMGTEGGLYRWLY
jgi:fumarate hydratase class I